MTSVISQHREETFNASWSKDKNSDYGFDNGEDLLVNTCTAAAKPTHQASNHL